ncbi:ABC transporter substrate-binding protein [Tenggerimyces flavus]|uniref:ABC transporter substrate-binding protein n=1 Tax=Tenggerimyces flavus TaxID=1708749 RepID=A0ABV7YMX1_9ACTN|nr:ABC transporter substrate-binding protein [Tenggerimyces flavus]MBM7787701.1 peptide/nickel transport system substrate-binding protein [Tenggerimyces flavus]
MNATPTPPQRAWSRRQVLEIFGAGVVGAAALAACAPSNQANPGGGNGATGGPKGPAEFHGAWPFQVPPKGHYNVVEGVTDSLLGGGPYIDLITLPPAMYLWKEKKWEYLIGESHELDAAAKTFTLKLKSGLKWSDGKPITSKDVVSTYWCLRIIRNVVWNYLEKVEAPDEQTVVFTMNNASTVMERYALRRQIYSDATYGEWATKAQTLFEGGGNLDTPEGTKLNTDFQAFRPEDVIASGPFKFDKASITNAQLTIVKNDQGFAADKVAYDKIVLFNGETPDITPVVLSGQVDYATHGFPPATEKAFESKGIRILRPPVYSGAALFFNMDKLPEFKDVKVRQAFAHAIDRAENGEVTLAESGKPVQFMCGFSDNLVPDWLSAEQQGSLNKYEFDQAKATTLLTEAGWKKQGDGWLKPDGKPAQYELIFHAEFADYSACGQNAAQQLTKFGIKTEGRGVTFTQQPIDVDKGNFQLAIQGWGSSSHPHPHFAFVADLFTHNIPTAKNQGGRGMGFELKTTTSAGPVDLEKAVTESGAGLDEAAQKQNVATVATAFNELVPIIPLFERYGNNAAREGDRVDAWPADSDPIMANAPYADNFTIMLMLRGTLKPA